jgi:hypothetical protein
VADHSACVNRAFINQQLAAFVYGPASFTVNVCAAMVSVPIRPEPGFGAALKLTVPFPVPDGALVIVSQSPLFDPAVHEHEVPVTTVIVTRPDPPAAGTDWRGGEMENVHATGTASWLTVNVCPATVNDPLRGAPGLDAAEKPTFPLPFPGVPLVIVSQSGLFDVAVHPHPAVVVTLTLPGPPAGGTAWLVGAMAKAHAASWMTVNVLSAIVRVPVRAAPLFGDTLKLMFPFPVATPPPEMVSQSGLFDIAVHPHAPDVATLTLPEPPLAPIAWLVGAIAKVHGADGCITSSVWPPIVTVPLRAAPALVATLRVIDPLPVPEEPPVIVIHPALDVAVHAQPSPAVTRVDPLPPPLGTSSRAGAIE